MIRASVTVGSLRAQVTVTETDTNPQVVRAAAAVSFEDPKLDLSVVSARALQKVIAPSALVRYISIVASVFEDHVGKNPILFDESLVSDQVSLEPLKGFLELLGTFDAQLFVIGKGIDDLARTDEDRSFVLSRRFTDLADATDDFLGEADADDQQVMLLGKTVPVEHQFVSDAETIGFGKFAVDVAWSADIKDLDLSKAMLDDTVVADVSAFSLGRSFEDGTLNLDNAVVDFGKIEVDHVDAATQTNYALRKPLFDVGQHSDYAHLDTSKVLEDGSVTLDFLTASLSKLLLDTADASDDFNADVATDDGQVAAFTKSRVDHAATRSTANYEATKPRSDAAALSDGYLLGFEKSLVDEFVASELLSFDIDTQRSDETGALDAEFRHFYKSLADFISVSDAVLLHPGLFKQDAASIEDDPFVVYLPAEGIPAQDEQQIVADDAAYSLQRFLQDVKNNTDETVWLFDKSATEIIATQENRSWVMTREVQEEADVADGGYLFSTNYCDSTYFSQPYVGVARTF